MYLRFRREPTLPTWDTNVERVVSRSAFGRLTLPYLRAGLCITLL